MRIVVAMTGATGAAYGIRLLEVLKELGVERHLVMSEWAEVTLRHETSWTLSDVRALASVVHARTNQGASIASGSFRHDGMIVAPCSMRSLAAIRHGTGDGLIARAADVTLKERRRLVLLARESPLSEVHLENMLGLTRMGAIVARPCPRSTTIRRRSRTSSITRSPSARPLRPRVAAIAAMVRDFRARRPPTVHHHQRERP